MTIPRPLSRTVATGGVLLLALAACSTDDGGAEPAPSTDGSATDAESAESTSSDADADADADESTTDDASASASPESSSSDAGESATGHSPGQHEFSAEIDGHTRTGVVLLPESWTPDADLPLVLNLHGSRSDGAEHVRWADAAENADAEGYVVLLPNGGIENPGDGWLWNVPGVTEAPEDAPDDVAFLRALIDWAAQEYGTSTDDVFASGYSGGGRMISQAACEDPTLFRAIAPVTGLRSGVPVEEEGGTWAPDPETCAPGSVTPIITFVGEDDPVNPLGGGGADYWGYGHEAALARWTEIGGFEVREESEQQDGVTLTTIGDGTGPDEIQSWSIADAGHVWPGSPAFEDETDWAGTPTDAIEANELIWDFFAQHLSE
ncbi:MAG: alpha/beta hydrolase family esterase [Actinomycetaceae bacterium]